MSKEFKEEFLIPLIVIVFWIVWLWLLFRGLEEYTFWMGWIMAKHDAQRCERAIEYNLTVPYYCTTWDLYTND